jgi:transcriptional regulator with XRE-family HTH domain
VAGGVLSWRIDASGLFSLPRQAGKANSPIRLELGWTLLISLVAMQVLFVTPPVVSPDVPYTLGMKQNRSTLGERIASARQAAGFTQQHLAEHLGVSQQMVGYLELRPVAVRPELLARLSEVLRVPLDELVGGNSAPRRPTGPAGRVRRVFEEVNKLPRSRQQRILATVEDMLTAQRVASGS